MYTYTHVFVYICLYELDLELVDLLVPKPFNPKPFNPKP